MYFEEEVMLPIEQRDVQRVTETECVRSVEAGIFCLRHWLIKVSPDTTTTKITGGGLLSEQSDSVQTVSFEGIPPCMNTGLEHSLSSGSYLIDFDYTILKNTITMRASVCPS